MNSQSENACALAELEALIFEKFEHEPFQNLNRRYGQHLDCPLPGGTCSEKSLSFINSAKLAGFNAALHTGFIKGEEIHRLARIHINGKTYFADVGNGWPALKLYPADEEVIYECFGMRFRTEICGSRITVFNERNFKEYPQLEIEIAARNESDIQAEIANRYEQGIKYPFSGGVRFAQIIDNRFLFLRDRRLEIHSVGTMEMLENIAETSVPDVLTKYFNLTLPDKTSQKIRERSGHSKSSSYQ